MAAPGFPPLKREPLLEEELPAANPTVRLIKGARIKFAPGQPTGLHRHPISTCGRGDGRKLSTFSWKGSRFSFSKPAIVSSSRPATPFSSSTTPRRPSRPRSSAFIWPTRRSVRRSKCSQAAWTASWARHSGCERPNATATKRCSRPRAPGTAEIGGVDAPWRDTVRPHKLIAHFARAELRNTFGARGGGPAQ